MQKKMWEMLNNQVRAEFYASYLYLSMAADFAEKGLPGFAHWMRMQTLEEKFHAEKIFDYLIERGQTVELLSIDGPPTGWENPTKAFQAALEHEKKVTGLIDRLVETAEELKDHATTGFLQWFVDEQVEEEAALMEVLDKLRLVGNEGYGLYMLDREMASRVFTAPAAE